MKNGFGAGFGLLLALCTPAVWAAEEESPWIFDGEVVLGYDSNVSRAGFTRDVVEDATASESFAVAWNHEFGEMSAMTLRGFVEGEQFADIDSLNRGSAGVQAIYRWQHKLGFSAPFFQASLAAQTDDFASVLRDADRYTAQVFMTKRITDALRASVGLEGMLAEADGKVFDLAQTRLFVNADLALNDRWAVYGTWSVINGDTTSSAQLVFCNGASAVDLYGLIDAANAVETDEALNDALCGSWLAYRLPALTHTFVVGINRGFGHHLSLDVSAQQVMVSAEGDNEYKRTLLRAGILARF